jgi:3,4-dihydroxy 2-butanone 4-phosphate synthase/GTP cyclohydrolase II
MKKKLYKISQIKDAIKDIKSGIPIIVVDNAERENEGDLVVAAQKANVDNISFCMRYARGLMCIPCEGKILDQLKIPMMVKKTEDPLETPFTVSVDAKTTSSGMSVYDRLKTIKVFLNKNLKAKQLQRPGHMFPLRPRNRLLKERQGHTEASIVLMKLAKLKEVAIIVEIINDNGTMARGNDLKLFSKKHNLKIISIDEIIKAFYN